MSSLRRLADVATGQWGLITTAQAAAVGVSAQSLPKLVGNGSLERLAHGVYRVAGAPMDPCDDLRVAWLGLEPGRSAGQRLADDVPDVVSDRSAALLYGYGDLDADQHEFTVAARRQSRRRDVRFHRRKLQREDWTVRAGLPVTTAVVTIRDLAATNLDGDHLAAVVRDAVLDATADPDQVSHVLRPFARAYGAPVGDGVELLRRLLATAGIPTAIKTVVRLAAEGQAGAARRAG